MRQISRSRTQTVTDFHMMKKKMMMRISVTHYWSLQWTALAPPASPVLMFSTARVILVAVATRESSIRTNDRIRTRAACSLLVCVTPMARSAQSTSRTQMAPMKSSRMWNVRSTQYPFIHQSWTQSAQSMKMPRVS